MNLTLAAALLCALSFGCGKDSKTPEKTDVSGFNGLVINEVAAHDETTDADSWVEILNTSSSSMDLSGVSLFLTDSYFNGKKIYTAPTGTKLASGARMVVSTEDEGLVTGIASTSQFELKLAVSDGTAIDIFSRSAAFASPKAIGKVGSYQRIPDGSSTWRNLTYSSEGQMNKVFSLNDTHSTAVWVWSSHIEAWLANDAAEMKRIKSLGYDHVLLNYAAFENNPKRCHDFIAEADKCGITVHAWIQCFHTSTGWINPIDMTTSTYKEDVFADIRAHAKKYIEDFGVKGLHLDYIRFGGNAYKYNPTADVTAVGAVTRCCKEMRELADSYDEGIVTSAALMPEKSGAYYYGQDYNQMGKYLHILMPMIYKYSYGYSDATCKSLADMFASNTGGAKCWAGTTTYKGNDSGVTPMDADGILADCKVYLDTKASGIVLFRYGLGTFPDVNDLW